MRFAYYCVKISESNNNINSLSLNPVFSFQNPSQSGSHVRGSLGRRPGLGGPEILGTRINVPGVPTKEIYAKVALKKAVAAPTVTQARRTIDIFFGPGMACIPVLSCIESPG